MTPPYSTPLVPESVCDSVSDPKKLAKPAKDRPTIFSLPAELMNHIYELVLFPNGDRQCIVTEAPIFPEPPLLRTCTRIRAEAASIFWQETRFQVNVNDFDPTVLRRFEERMRWVSHRSQVQFSPGQDASYARVWHNLLFWLELYHRGHPKPSDKRKRKHGMEMGIEDIIRVVCPCHEQEVGVIRGMFVVVKAMRPQSWKATRAVLEWQRDNLLALVEMEWTN